MSDKLKIEPDGFVDYMHKTYPGLEGLPFRTAMLEAFNYLSGNYHALEKERKKIGEQIQKKIDESRTNDKGRNKETR